MNTTQARLTTLDKKIIDLIEKRNKLLKEFRENCKHLRLVEIANSCLYSGSPPWRICMDCGAEEQDWHCGCQVLVTGQDTWAARTPHSRERFILLRTMSREEFYRYRKNGWPLYHVGQSHPNFKGGGPRSYRQLTRVLKDGEQGILEIEV